jgi:hypothetical protein
MELPSLVASSNMDEECGSEIGPWGIDDCLSVYVTDAHHVGNLNKIKGMPDDD